MLPLTFSLENILFLLLIITVLVQFFYGFYYFLSLALHKKHLPFETPGFPVSVIVCAHNEYENLMQLVPKLLKQEYPKFELILIDDRSKDETNGYMQQVTQYFPNTRLITIKNTPAGFNPKKYALSMGIKSASYDHLLLTDADCVPLSERWIAEMMKGYRAGADMVLGYGRYRKIQGFLGALIQYETLLSAMQYLSFAIKGKAYMGVGRNLSYTKTCFYRNKGFASHIRATGGDDDLFVQEAAENSKINVIIGIDGQTESQPKETWREWWRQKRRHLGAGKKYKWTDRLRIGTFILSNIFFYIVSVVLLAMQADLVWLGLIFGVRCLVIFSIYYQAASNLKERLSVVLIPILDIAFFVYYVLLSVSVLMFKKVTWK
ncbi:glycosyltransferase [Adhaeribacter soli]|uniref:Glycosyltransferase n=1 Tax=Adhaeribacter soli TaxID=2607655 RepID=A0A5N1IUI6_9BACT|nr:glycosyltransferase [Adhaeribacter soli]KAA9333601.1 glycosyltransferase [Adhaeribacter soli]